MFGTTNPNVFTIGVNGGAGTALSTGVVTITATKDNKVARATVVALGEDCCDDQPGVSAIVVDASMSMSTDFDGADGGSYPSRLAYAKAVATAYANNLLTVDNVVKDSIKVWDLGSDITDLTTTYRKNETELAAAIAGIQQSLEETNLLLAVTTAADDLMEQDGRKILVIISDGEHTTDTERQAIIDAARNFKTAGGIIITIGVRANGNGYDLLERICTVGFFLNALPTNPADVIAWLNYWKELLCVGKCVPAGDVFVNTPQLDYSSFENWEVIDGQVHLLGPGLLDLQPGNGLYVDMAGGSPATIRTIDSFELNEECAIRVSFRVAGNQRLAVPQQRLKVYLRDVTAVDGDPNLFETVVSMDFNQEFQTFAFAFTPAATVTARLYFEQLYNGTPPVRGNLLDSVKLECSTTGEVLFEDNFDDENPIYVPPRCGPSAAIEAIDNPPAPEVEWLSAGSLAGGLPTGAYYHYTYGYSWVTDSGETAITPIDLNPEATPEYRNSQRLVRLESPPDRVISVRIWRSLGEDHLLTVSGAGTAAVNGDYIHQGDGDVWQQDGGPHQIIFEDTGSDKIFKIVDQSDTAFIFYSIDADEFPDLGVWASTNGLLPVPTVAVTAPEPVAVESAMFLLAEVSPSNTTYLDEDSPAEFEARYEPSVTAPTENTTAQDLGALGFGYEYCCGYGDYDAVGSTELMPPMTSNTEAADPEFEGYVVSENPDTQTEDPSQAWKAFDGTANLDGWFGTMLGPTLPWLQVQFPAAQRITAYRIATAGYENHAGNIGAPKSWTLSGSNDGVNFTVIDAVTGFIGFTGAEEAPFEPQFQRFEVDAPGTFSIYRLEITALQDGSLASISEMQFESAGAETFPEDCQECLDEPGAQLPDPEPTLDIEGEIEPITTYTSTKNACFRCPQGFLSLSTTNVTFTPLTLIQAGAGPWSQIVQLVDPTKVVGHYELSPYAAETGLCGPKDFTFQGTNDEGAATDDPGTVWVTLDTQVGQAWAGDLVNRYYLQNQGTAYKYYRLLITAFACGSGTVGADFDSLTESFLHPKGASQSCIGATEQSQVSQVHADQLAFITAAQGALDAFLAANTCAQFWNRTVAYTATCAADDSGTGADVTMSASYTSLIGESHALDVAERIAKAAAVAALVCV